MGKPKSLADRIAETKSQNILTSEADKEKSILKAITKVSKRTSEQQSNRATEQASGHLLGQLSEQVSNRTSEQLPRQVNKRTSEQQSNRATEQVGSFNIDLKPNDLKLNQYQILFEIYFNRPFKVSGPERIGLRWDPQIAYGTVRNALSSLEKKKYISKPISINDGVIKGTTCQVSESKCKPIFGDTSIINSEQVNNRASEQQNRCTREQASTSNSQLVSSFIYLKLTDYLKNSDYWQNQNLNIEKVKGWIRDYEICTEEYVLKQLQMGEVHSSITNAKSPVDCFFSIMVYKGGLTRPPGFEFPEEKKARLEKETAAKMAESLKIIEEAIQIKEDIRKQERELADQESFLMLLEDHDAVKEMVNEIKKGHMTSTLKASINTFLQKKKIDSRLENRLKIYFQTS